MATPSSSVAHGHDWNALVVKLESSDEGTRCALRDGRSILLTEGWKRHVRIVARKFEQAHAFWERFSPHADRIALLRSRIEREPVEEREAHAWCVEQGLSASIDVRLVSWHPDYHEVFYRELASRARQIYLFRNEYVFVLEGMVITEIPQFGHAAYFFRPPGTSSQFLRAYTQTTRHRIRCDPSGSRKTLGYQGRLPHLHDTAAWLEKLQHWVSGKAVRRAFI